MNQREGFHSFGKRPLPIESSCYEYNRQSFRQNAASGQNPNNSSSQIFNQFISDYALNGSLKNESEYNPQFNQFSNSNQKTNFTFGEEPYFFDTPDQHQTFSLDQENNPDATLENRPETEYNDLAFQAQQLLDKINNNFQDCNTQTNNPPSQYNISNHRIDHSIFNSETNQSSPAPKLQPILQNTEIFKSRTSEQKISGSNQKITQPPIKSIRHLNQYQQNGFNSNYNFANSNQFNQFQKPPQATFASPMFLRNTNYEPNMKRLNTASEMVYPDNHIELLRHSYDS